MRSSRPSARRPLARWFTSLFNARYGVLLGFPLAAALITMLIWQASPPTRTAEVSQPSWMRIEMSPVRVSEYQYDQRDSLHTVNKPNQYTLRYGWSSDRAGRLWA